MSYKCIIYVCWIDLSIMIGEYTKYIYITIVHRFYGCYNNIILKKRLSSNFISIQKVMIFLYNL